MLAQVGDFTEQLRRTRLRRFRIDRQLRGNLCSSIGGNVRLALGIELRDSIERLVQPEIVDRVAEGEIGEAFRPERFVARHQRPGQLRFHERLAHEIFRGHGQIERERTSHGRRGGDRDLEGVRPIFLHLEIAAAGELVLLRVLDSRHPIFPDAARRDLHVFRERAELGKRHSLRKNLAVPGVTHLDRDRLAGGQRRLILVQVARDPFEMNNVARFVDTAFREKKNGARIGLVAEIVGNPEPIKRDRRVAGVDRDEVGVTLTLRVNPARIAAVRKARATLRVGHGFGELLLLGIEQAKLSVGQRLAGGEREKMQREIARIAFPNRADIRQLDDSLRADAFSFRRDRIDRFRRQQDCASFVLAQNFVPAQRQRLGLVDARGRL